MSILVLLVILVVLALAIYGVQRYAPGNPALKGIICLVLILAACVALLSWAGVIPGGSRGGLRL